MELNKFLFPEQSFQAAIKALDELKNLRIVSEEEYEGCHQQLKMIKDLFDLIL